ncbi:33908_t:CDS:2, partial [Racocetra persica]
MIKYIGKVLMDLIKHDIESIHEHLVIEGNTSNKDRIKANIVGVWLSDSCQVIFLEMSRAPTDFLKNHPVDDVHKTLQEQIDSLNSILLNFLNYNVRFAGGICFLTIQGIKDRLILRLIFLRGKDDYIDKEIISADIKLIEEGRYGKVYHATLKNNEITVVLKSFKSNNVTIKKIVNE